MDEKWNKPTTTGQYESGSKWFKKGASKEPYIFPFSEWTIQSSGVQLLLIQNSKLSARRMSTSLQCGASWISGYVYNYGSYF